MLWLNFRQFLGLTVDMEKGSKPREERSSLSPELGGGRGEITETFTI